MDDLQFSSRIGRFQSAYIIDYDTLTLIYRTVSQIPTVS